MKKTPLLILISFFLILCGNQKTFAQEEIKISKSLQAAISEFSTAHTKEERAKSLKNFKQLSAFVSENESWIVSYYLVLEHVKKLMNNEGNPKEVYVEAMQEIEKSLALDTNNIHLLRAQAFANLVFYDKTGNQNFGNIAKMQVENLKKKNIFSDNPLFLISKFLEEKNTEINGQKVGCKNADSYTKRSELTGNNDEEANKVFPYWTNPYFKKFCP